MTQRAKKSSSKTTRQHKYRVSIYLGKELYETLKGVAEFMGIPLATATRILLETGVQIGKSIDKKGVEAVRKNGNKS